MKKIQVTTIEKTANVEIIELNSHFISKAVKALISAQMVGENVILMNHGKDTFSEAMEISPDSARRITEDILPFLQELYDAFEGNEKEKKE